MKMYVASFSDKRDYDWIIGVYDSVERADKAIEDEQGKLGDWDDPDNYYWRVSEYEVNR